MLVQYVHRSKIDTLVQRSIPALPPRAIKARRWEGEKVGLVGGIEQPVHLQQDEVALRTGVSEIGLHE